MNENLRLILRYVTIIVSVLCVCATAITLSGYSVTDLLAVVGVVAVPVVIALVAGINANVKQVQDQTNGNTSQLHRMVGELLKVVATTGPVAPETLKQITEGNEK